MTRRISEIAAILLLILLHAGISLADPTITVGSASGLPGNTVTVPVTLDNTTGLSIASITIDINFDPTKLSYVSCELNDGTACDYSLNGTYVNANSNSLGNVRFFKFNSDITNITSGVLAQLSFRIDSSVSPGQIALQNSYYQIFDTDFNDILPPDINLINGIITVPDTTAPTITTPFLPASYTNATVPIALNATDNVAVTGYCVSESQDPGSCSWSGTAPTSYNFSGISILVPTHKTLYAFAKDAAGNIGSASASVTITIPDTTPPVVTAFSGPSTSTSPTISGITLSATDNISVSGYCLTETADYGNCVWSATPPASFTFNNVPQGVATDMVIYAWANDGTNVSQPASFTVTITIPLKVLIITIDGSGSVNSDANVNCSGNLCIKGFPTDTVVTLMPTPGTSSVFAGWSGDCTNTSGNCVLTMTTDKNVKATFQLTPPVCINYPSSCYQTLQDAYDNAADGAVIRLKTGTLTGTLLAARSIKVTVEGGYDAGYATIMGETAIDGSVKVRSGKVNMRKVLVK